MILRLISILMKVLVGVLRFLGFGGTALPGIWVEKYYPSLMSQYAKHYKKVIFITGTNGKTTVQSALGKVLESTGYEVTGNFSGSNMLRGIATTLLSGGVPHKSTNPILLCEVEEATMPKLTEYIRPDMIIVTNMFRDQLDAYGELDKTAEYIRKACLNSPDALLILNGDDPVISTLSTGLSHKKVTYSLGEYAKQFQYEEFLDKSRMTSVQTLDIIAKSITVHDDLSTETQVENHGKTASINFAPPGMYNAYNALAAYAAAQELGVKEGSTISALAMVQSPFGRGEIVTVNQDKKTLRFQIFLVKNPAGYSQVWDMLSHIRTPFNLILALNDNIADGRDVSWIWDIKLQSPIHPDALQLISFTGRRAYDIALRLKYADIGGNSSDVVTDIDSCLDNMIHKSTNGRHCYVLATYTAMNQLRTSLSRYTTLLPYTI